MIRRIVIFSQEQLMMCSQTYHYSIYEPLKYHVYAIKQLIFFYLYNIIPFMRIPSEIIPHLFFLLLVENAKHL